MVAVYIFLGLIVALLLVAALLPKSYSIEKNVLINKPVEQVMSRVSDLNYYSKWNPWQQADPTAKHHISGNPGRPGHQYAWEGKKVGAGSLTLRELDQKHLHFDLQFLKPFKTSAKDNWLFEPWADGSQSKVTWQNSGHLSWPIASLMGPMLTKNLNHQFDKGLQNLKAMCESQQVESL